MKRKLMKTKNIIGLAVIIVAIMVGLRFGIQYFISPAYNAMAPTGEKFEKITKWIPQGSEFYVVADVQKMFSDPVFAEQMTKLGGENKGIVSEFINALTVNQKKVGMLMIVGQVQTKPLISLVAQGDLKKDDFLLKMRQILADDKAGLVTEDVGGRTIYLESDSRDPFGFTILDKEHIAVGSRDSLITIFNKDNGTNIGGKTIPDSAVFGHLELGPMIKGLLPEKLSPADGMDFVSPDGKNLVATILCKDPNQAKDITAFLEGIRSVLLFKNSDDTNMQDAVKAVKIENNESSVMVLGDMLSFLSILPL